MNIKLLGDRVLVEIEKKEEKTASGLVISKTPEPGSMMIGKAVAVGMGKKNDEGKILPVEISCDDKIMFNYGTNVSIEGKSYILVNEADVIMII